MTGKEYSFSRLIEGGPNKFDLMTAFFAATWADEDAKHHPVILKISDVGSVRFSPEGLTHTPIENWNTSEYEKEWGYRFEGYLDFSLDGPFNSDVLCVGKYSTNSRLGEIHFFVKGDDDPDDLPSMLYSELVAKSNLANAS